MGKKKVNRNRVPIKLDPREIAELTKATTGGCVLLAWAVVLAALSDYRDIAAADMVLLWDIINQYPTSARDLAGVRRELAKVNELTGVAFPVVLNADDIHTQGELNRYVKRAHKNAVSTSMAILLESIISKNLLPDERLRTVVRKAQLMLEEIEEGSLSVPDIQEMLLDEYQIQLSEGAGGATLQWLKKPENPAPL